MKGFYEPKISSRSIAYIYKCDHPLYKSCTLFKDGEVGLAVIQQRFNGEEKVSWWGAIDSWIIDDLIASENWTSIFAKRAGACENGLYPTIEVRKLMYAVGLKPLKKQFWETTFRDPLS